MESPNNLEFSGSLRTNPLAELLCEIADKEFNGSLRLGREAHKIIVYFQNGEIVFVASNARQHRLFETLRQAEKFSGEQLAAIPDYTNDLALRENLSKENLLEKAEIDRHFSRSMDEILQTAAEWRDGEWTFSPLVRIKSGIRVETNPHRFLIEYARNSLVAETVRRFKNPTESLRAAPRMPSNVNLSPRESFVFSRFENAALTVEEIESLSGLPADETIQILYALWLGGFVARPHRHSAFSEKQTEAILSAKLSVKKEEAKPIVEPPKQTETSAAENQKTIAETGAAQNAEATEETATDKKEISLEEYLERIENATDFYEIFDLPPESAVTEIKRNYFALAKRFHPDLFYKQADAALLQRIQHAFSEIARAYETLKHESSRETYDFKIRKELAGRKEQAAMATAANKKSNEDSLREQQIEQAALNFEQGFDYLMEENPSAAEAFLARAVYFDKGNARYHAYYGKALAADNKQRHKAEAELQTAVKLDGENADYRIMLAEFFIQVGLRKRAEGELNRLLAIAPNNSEAKALLDSLGKK